MSKLGACVDQTLSKYVQSSSSKAKVNEILIKYGNAEVLCHTPESFKLKSVKGKRDLI